MLGTDFSDFKKSITENNRQTVVNGLKSAPKKNPDPF
jgi:hypothetical protein